MTNEEAIKAIEVVRNYILKDPSWLKSFTDKVNEAVDMAINALTAQPETHEERTETHGVCLDTISRQAAISVIAKWMLEYGGEGEERERNALKQAAEEIKELPSAQPERKTGRWIDETFKPWGLVYHPYKCDQCGEHSEADSDFCPNCGADMRGEPNG